MVEIDPSMGVPSYYATSVISVTPEYVASSGVSLGARVIDVVCKLGVESKTLTAIDPKSSSISAGGYKIATNKTLAMEEVKALHSANNIHIELIDRYKMIAAACVEILDENGFNAESDNKRLSSLEASVGKMQGDMSEIRRMFTELFGDKKTEKNENDN